MACGHLGSVNDLMFSHPFVTETRVNIPTTIRLKNEQTRDRKENKINGPRQNTRVHILVDRLRRRNIIQQR
jgi:hypothetical protein